MKFGKQLQLGIYEPWKAYYIQYNRLKRIILRKKFNQEKIASKSYADLASMANSGVNSSKPSRKSTTDLPGLEMPMKNSILKTISKIGGIQTSDFTREEIQPLKKPSSTLSLASSIDNTSTQIDIQHSSADDVEFFVAIEDEIQKINKFFLGKVAEAQIKLDEIMIKRKNAYRSHHAGSSEMADMMKIRDIYVELVQLQAYSDLNKTGFYKIIKKYDKAFNDNKLEEWLLLIDKQAFVVSGPMDVSLLMDKVTSLVSRDKLLEWEVFAKEMHKMMQEDKIFPSVKPYGLAISCMVFFVSLTSGMPSFKSFDQDSGDFVVDVQASRCMSLVMFVVLMWITEAIPYFATSILIPVLVTFLGVLRDPKHPSQSMKPEDAADYCLNHIFNHTTMLLLGGYTISAAFSRCQLELRVASILQESFGNRPKVFILAIMFLGLFLSMWISNHTAPILCATIILPIVRDLPTESKFSKSLLLGLAFGCNFGGMMTPISSLQNALAVSQLQQAGIDISFGRWLGISLPFCVICTLIAWIVIIGIIQPNDVTSIPSIVYETSQKVFSRRNTVVITASGLAIFLFATSSFTKFIFGDIGIISLCVVGFMYGAGLLTEVDFNSQSWHTLFLIGGGNVLGKAVSSSGLIEYLARYIIQALPMEYPWLALVCILLFAATVATFVSHTVAALILLPIIAKIGVALGVPQITVIGSAFAISAAMALPFSSFPNVNSLLIVDDFQNQYLGVRDFILTGLPMSVIAVILAATLGYALMTAVGI